MSDNIKVVVKVRPLISREIEEKLSYQWRVQNNTLYQLDQNGKDLGQSFTFDKVYDKHTKTSAVYDDIAKPIVQAATAGFNGTIFAYGQTSSGKTYTMSGTDSSPGIIPLAVINLFETIKNVPDRDFLVRVSYIEIYNETVKDLLNIEKANIKVTETLQGDVKVLATEKVTSSPEEVLKVMKEGEANRQKGSTNMNEQSSRSHSIFQITIESREHVEGEEEVGCVNVSQLNLVDLAGSERAGQTGATGIRFKEGTHINKSLSALALVIKQLSEDPNKYANYRDSKLTRILSNSLGGNAKTSIICAVTPAAVEETISTLQFANRAKAIKNKPEVNAVATNDTMIQSLTKQMCKLQAQLESKKNLEKDNCKLQNEIANLKKLILNGFVQRHNVDLFSGTRRKLQQPRRITISTLQSIENEPIVSIPKFCTPSLKFNPLTIPKPAELVAPAPARLPSVPEEARARTPPRAPLCSGEVIDLDSDDETPPEDVQTCSPIHKCYGSSKTPPCILRRNAKVAERNLKDIVELTEREKIYTPSVVEYIEKLEQNTAVIAKLQEEIQNLNQQSKDKDLIVDHLKTKIKKTEEDMKVLASAKTDLQTQCNNYSTKLTDAEVSYETLRNKAKLREEELLSLLEELNARNKKPEDIGKILSRTLDNELHFMDISKDISLVNSDNEGSIVTAIDEESDHITDIITDSQTQITSRDQIITELQANLLSQQEKISFLENLNQDLQLKVNSFKEKLNTMENANDLLKSTIDTLNSTVKNQQAHLETANNDIESYNSCIQELQIKLLQKANLPNIDINDSVLESMIANEEQFIASNENMKNIIHSLKIALDTRNKEIDILKTTHNNNQELTLEIKTLKEHLEAKTIELNALDVERENMNKQINEYIATINNILQENNNLKVVEHNLSEKLVILEDRVKELEKCSREEAICICNLREENSKLTLEIADNNVAKQEMSETNNQLLKQIDEMRDKITELEKDISIKSDLICSLNKEDKESKEYLVKAKAAVLKSQLILNTLSGNMQEVPEIIDNFVNIFSALSDSMNTLENVANDIVSQKEEAIKNNIDLKNTLEALTAKHNSEITGLQDTINTLRETERNTYQENDTLTHKINHLSVELQVACNELDTKKSENQLLEAHLNQAREKIELCNQQMTALREVKLILDQTLHDKDTLIADKIKKLEAIECVLKDKISEMAIVEERLNNSQQEQHELLTSIYRKMTALTKNFNIENDKTENIEYNCGKIHKQILLTLDKIGNHIAFISSNTADDECKKVSKILLEAKKEIVDLTQRNLNLMQQLSEIENKNSKLSIELKNIKKENKILNEDLLGSQNILQSLHTELKMKALELTEMEGKARDCKEQFTQLDYVMKREMYDLKLENENLKARKKGPDQSVMIYEHTDSYGIDNQDETVKRHVSELSTSAEASSPPSLLTICCNKIIDSIQPKDVESKTTTISSNAQVSVQSDETYVVKCKCNQLSSELETARDENARLLDLLEQLELVNQNLIEEQEAVRSEIQLLAAPAQELQKKIFNHKTNLSILTATTFAENTSLKSQVKGLQHHHSRFHNVCQRDIPDFKKQLRELMTLLKGDPSISDQQNTSFKRYSLPDVLDSSTALPNFKNESTLDGDLLMLDTNITITTAADNTLTGHDQTCLDLTQYYNEAACQTNELNLITDQNIQQMEILSHDNQSMYQKINMLKDENDKLSELVNKFTEIKTLMTDTQTSPIKTNNYVNENLNKSSTINEIEALYKCTKCEKEVELQRAQEKLNDEIKSLAQELCVVKSQKAEMEQKYNNLVLEIPKTDTLVHKLNILEKDYDDKIQDITKLSKTLAIKNQELKNLQDENDALSTQVMENITEADDLNKELTNLKQNNRELIDKCSILEQSVKEYRDKEKSFNVSCSECIAKDELIQTMEKRLTKTHTKLNRSLSDSDTSSRYNKICTLQSELHAGREDCKELTEDVVTIKNHLERSNLSMDLDDSMGESNIYTFPKDIGMVSPQSNKCIMPDIPEERPSDIYIMDKIDCFNYYAEKTGLNKDNFDRDVKIIELMKIFYENIITKHYNEVENLTNKLKDYNEAKSQLEIQYCELMEKHSQVTTQLEQKDQSYNDVLNILSQIKNNIHFFNQDITEMDNTILINMYKDHILKVLDNGLGLSSVEIFESLIDNIVNKNKTELDKILERNNKLQENMESLTKDLNSINENLAQLKAQLSAKENEYNLLKSQKERIHEINNAVTLDIVKKDKELTETITNGYKRLAELNILNNQVFDLTLPININVNLLFEHLINQHKNTINPDLKKEKEDLVLEVKNSKQAIEEKQKEIEALQSHAKTLREINNGVTMDLVEKENTLQAQKSLHEDLKKIYESKVEENTANVELIEKLSQEIKLLKATIEDKDKAIEKLEMNKNQRNEKDVKITELIDTLKQLKDDISHLKTMNEIIVKEKEAYATELLKSGETIKRNNIEMDRMTSDILILKESVKENGVVIENLNVEVRNLLKQNIQLKEQLEEKCRECFRLETNMKTHEKTAEIQTRMIVRLEKQKNDDDKTMSEKSKQIEELTHKCAALQKQCETLQIFAKERDALEQLKSVKETLEARVAELEMLLEGYKSRQSIDAIADSSRRRRQSLHDSKRIFAEDKNQFEDQNNVEAVFDSRPKPDDLFMDVDEYDSNGSTPIRLSKGHESLSLSRTDQSDKDDEHPSRPSSVVATRRRRQSTHDLHRSVLRHTPSPHGLESANRILDEFNHSKPDTSGGNESEVSQLKQRLASCQQELEDIKEKYRELDEECETCAEYLRERDEQCSRLKKERASLQVTIAELKEKLRSQNQSQLDVLTPSVAHVAVNTDEDWTNLHSVVVDRMSFDAEVEKNKRLTKTIEELRFKKQDLKNTLAKMQKALDKNSGSRELESAKHELHACKQELAQLRQSYKELDEECETCAQYLREKEEQCRRLKEAKTALEAKLLEFQGDMGVSIKTHSTRKKRQSLHDQQRDSTVEVVDASTETSDDFLSYQVERDGSYRPLSEDMQAGEVKRLKSVAENLSKQKAALEQKLMTVSASMYAPHPMYVATGSAIVQNQQLTDVMKENQKLKKINAKLINICKKRGKDSNRENEDPSNQG